MGHHIVIWPLLNRILQMKGLIHNLAKDDRADLVMPKDASLDLVNTVTGILLSIIGEAKIAVITKNERAMREAQIFRKHGLSFLSVLVRHFVTHLLK